MSEGGLGILKVGKSAFGGYKYEGLLLASDRVSIVEFPKGAVFGQDYGADLERFVKNSKIKFVIPNAEIGEIELKKTWAGTPKLTIITSRKKYEGSRFYIKHEWTVEGLIPEKKDVTLEDYENILRSIFGDKLSVKQ
ncbi:MAG: hypothetical protein OEZ29_01425 [Candidatus Bathyarchaeota archaeon]|nr:hypothetical protein [Candidatus Bathyarchaeota archaeon]MDH5779237.1 hypothetical protein [Candidatus Bathyarchaeota archaeon]